MAIPCDDLITDTKSATRAIELAAPPGAVWPWLTQLGYGKAGWYSYHWIDNDGQPSANAVMPEYSSIAIGDRILIVVDMGLAVKAVDPGRSIVSLLEDGTTSWCLGLSHRTKAHSTRDSMAAQVGQAHPGQRLPHRAVDSGSFVKEKMLRGIRDRAEHSTQLVASYPASAIR